MQKEHERFFVERAAELLGKKWTLEDCECPDFIVTEGAQKFGLEVRDLFTGQHSRAGSHLKRMESKTQKAVNSLRCEYEASTDIPLIVRFVGDMCGENMAQVVPILLAEDFSSKPIGYQDVIDIDASEILRVYVTRAIAARWFCVNDRVGWVEDVARLTAVMVEASEMVMKSLACRVDAEIVRYPDRYMDDGGAEMWNRVMGLLDAEAKVVSYG